MAESTGSAFGIEKEFLHDLLKEVAKGKLQLPDFQRGWVWPVENIVGLLASVSQAYPCGTLMALRTGGEVKFKQRPVEGAPLNGHSAERLLLDGQQRITSLYQTLLLGAPVKTQDIRRRPLEVWFYVDMRKALDPSTDREEAFLTVPASKLAKNFRGQVELDLTAEESEYERHLFPLGRTLQASGWRSAFQKHWKYAPEKIELWDRFEETFIERFKQYQLPVIELGADTRRHAVCQVFEKVNTGGVTLTVFELLTATFATDGFELRKDWTERQAQIRKAAPRLLQDFSNTDFLQAVTLLATRDRREAARAAGVAADALPRIGCRRQDMLALSLDAYVTWAPVVVKGLIRSAKFLHQQFIYDGKFLPYGSQLVPLAAVLGVVDIDWETEGNRRKLERWFWCGVFGELYGGTTETRFSRDLPEVLAWLDGAPELPRTVTDAMFSADRLLTLRTRISAAYKGVYALLMREGAEDWRTGVGNNIAHYFDEAVDIHHIFPRAWCEKQGIPASRYDSVVNKTPLSARTNRMIGGNAPSAYLPRVAKDAGIDPEGVRGHVESHLVNCGLLEADDFDGFFADRQQRLLTRIETAMGKAAAPAMLSGEEAVETDIETEDVEGAA